MQQTYHGTNWRFNGHGHTNSSEGQALAGSLQGRRTFQRLSQGNVTFYHLVETKGDRDCFFHAVNKVDLTRNELIKRLRAHAQDQEVRRAFAFEIRQFLYLGFTHGHEDPNEQEAYRKLLTEEFLALSSSLDQVENALQPLIVAARKELGEDTTKGKGAAELVTLLLEKKSPLLQAFSEAHQAVLDADTKIMVYCSQEVVFSSYVGLYLQQALGFIPFARRFEGEDFKTPIDVINELFQTNIQVFLADGKRVTAKRPGPPILVFHNGVNHFSGLEALDAEVSSDVARPSGLPLTERDEINGSIQSEYLPAVDPWADILDSNPEMTADAILQGLCAGADEEQFKSADAMEQSSAASCEYGYFLLSQGRDQEALYLLVKAAQSRENWASITYRPALLDVPIGSKSLQSDNSTITINASYLATFLLARLFLRRGEFLKAWELSLTLEQRSRQQPFAIHTFLVGALKKELSQAVSAAILQRSQAIYDSLKPIAAAQPEVASAFKSKLETLASNDEEVFYLLRDWFSSDQPFPIHVLFFVRQQTSQLYSLESKIAVCRLDESVRQLVLNKLEELRLCYEPLLEQTSKEAAGPKKAEADFVSNLLYLATYSAGEQALFTGKSNIAKNFFAYLMTQVHKCPDQLVEKSAVHLGQIYLAKQAKDDCIKAAGLFNYAYRLAKPAKKIEPITDEMKHSFALTAGRAQQMLLTYQAVFRDATSYGLLPPEVQSLKKAAKLLMTFALSDSAELSQRVSQSLPPIDGPLEFFTHRQTQCLEKITLVHAQMIQLCSRRLSPFSARELSLSDRDNKKLLKEIRTSITARIPKDGSAPEETQALFHEIAERMKGFIAQLFQQCVAACGQPPCEFAMVTLGSLARHEATPWSDLEFAFLLEEGKDSPEAISYFTDITHLMHLKVINLGETILPALIIAELKTEGFYDDVMPRGFAFDGGGVAGKGHKTPLGQNEQKIDGRIVAHEFRLIQTPTQMAQFQGTSQKYGDAYWFELEPHLPLELLNVDFVYGNDGLVKDYRKALQVVLDQPYKVGSIRDHLVFELLVEEDLIHFNPWSEIELSHAGRLLRAKNDLYRLPHLTLDRFALLASVSCPSSWEKIEILQKIKGILNPQGAKNLKWLLSETMRFRLAAYAQANRQREELNPLLSPFINDDATQTSRHFDLNPTFLTELTKIYQVLLPLYDTLEQFIKSRDIGALCRQSFWAENKESMGQIAMRLQQYEKAKGYFQALPETVKFLTFLGRIAEAEGDFGGAERYYLKLKSLAEQQLNQSSFDAEISKISDIALLASLYRDVGRFEEARRLLDDYGEAARPFSPLALSDLDKARWLRTKHVVDTELGLLAIELGDSAKAEKIFEGLLALSKGTEKVNVLANLALALSSRDLERSRQFCQEAIELNHKVYPLAHFSHAVLFNNLGRMLYEAGDPQQARNYYLRGLKIMSQLSGANPVQVALLAGLSEVYTHLSFYEQAEDRLHMALNIARRNIPHHTLLQCELYYGLAHNYFKWGRRDESEEYFVLLVTALRNLKQGSANRRLSRALRGSARVLAELGKLDAEEECSRQALELLEPLSTANPKDAIEALQTRGRYLLRVGKNDDGLALYERSLLMLRKQPGASEKNLFFIVALQNIGYAFVRAGRLQEALAILEPLPAFCTQAPNELMAAWNGLGLAYGLRGEASGQVEDHRRALICHTKAMNICQSLVGPRHPRIAPHLSNVASCLASLGKLGEAEANVMRAHALLNSTVPPVLTELRGVVIQFIKILQLKKDLSQEAIYLLQLLALSKRLGASPDECVSILARLVEIHSQQHRWDNVLEHIGSIISHYRENRELSKYFYFMDLMITAHSSLHQHGPAKECCEKLMADYEAFSLPKDAIYVSVSLMLVNICLALGEEDAAVFHCEQGLKAYDGLSRLVPSLKARLLIGLCCVYTGPTRKRDLVQARALLPRLNQALAELGDEHDLSILCNAAFVYLGLGQSKEAEGLLLQVIKRTPPQSDDVAKVNLAKAYAHLAELYGVSEEPAAKERALDYYSQALKLLPQLDALGDLRLKVLNNLGTLQKDLGQLGAAIKIFTTALEYAKRVCSKAQMTPVACLGNLLGCYIEEKDLQTAKKLLQEAWQMYDQLQVDQRPLARALLMNCQGKICQQEGDLDQAIGLFMQALADMEALYGPGHPHVVKLSQNLGLAYQQRDEQKRVRE